MRQRQVLPGNNCRVGAKTNQSLTIGGLSSSRSRNRWPNGAIMAAEADIDDATDEVVEQPRRKFRISMRLLIVLAAGTGLLLAIGVAAYLLVFADFTEKKPDTLAVVPETFIFNLPSMTVNLNSGGQSEQFMKLTIALEVESEEMMAQIQPRLAKVVDAFQVYLRELRKSDLEGSAGIYRLKEELRRRVNLAIFPAQVENILFREILIQ